MTLRGVAPSLPQMMQVPSVPLGLVSTQAPLISHSTRLAKLPFLQKAATVIVIVEFTRIQDYNERRERAYVRDKLNIRTNAPPHLSLKVVCKRGVVFLGAYSTSYANPFSHSLRCIYQLSLVEPCQDRHQQERSRRR